MQFDKKVLLKINCSTTYFASAWIAFFTEILHRKHELELCFASSCMCLPVHFASCKSSSIWGATGCCHGFKEFTNLWMKLPPFMVLVALSRQEELNTILLWFPLFSFNCYVSLSMNFKKSLQYEFTTVRVVFQFVIQQLIVIKQTNVQKKM